MSRNKSDPYIPRPAGAVNQEGGLVLFALRVNGAVALAGPSAGVGSTWFEEIFAREARVSSNAVMFTGHERDTESASSDNPDGLDYMLARYYSSSLGRFMEVDPASRSIDLYNPQSWNRYSYALNNPLRYIDPDGLASTTKVKVNSDTSATVTTTTPTIDKNGDVTREVTTETITVNANGSFTETTTTSTTSTANPGATSTSGSTATFGSAQSFAAGKGVSVKQGVDLSNVSAASLATIGVVAGAAKDLGLPAPVITSGREGNHQAGSLHFAIPSRALDYRGNNISDAQLRGFARTVGTRLGTEYDAVAEFHRNPADDHLHVEYDP